MLQFPEFIDLAALQMGSMNSTSGKQAMTQTLRLYIMLSLPKVRTDDKYNSVYFKCYRAFYSPSIRWPSHSSRISKCSTIFFIRHFLWTYGTLTVRKSFSNLYAPPPVAQSVVCRLEKFLSRPIWMKRGMACVGKRMKCRFPVRPHMVRFLSSR